MTSMLAASPRWYCAARCVSRCPPHRALGPPVQGRQEETTADCSSPYLAVGTAVGRQAPGQRSRRWPGATNPAGGPVPTNSPRKEVVHEELTTASGYTQHAAVPPIPRVGGAGLSENNSLGQISRAVSTPIRTGG